MSCNAIFQLIQNTYLFPGCIIGINGVDTSGKSQFSNKLSHYLSEQGICNTVISIDDFHNPAALRRKGANAIDAYYQNAFDFPRLVREILAPWRQTGYLHHTTACLNLDTDQYDRKLVLDLHPQDVLILEGSLLFREPLLPYLDIKIFLDITFTEMLRRAAQRDVPRFGTDILRAYKDKYIPVQQHYFHECRPKCTADLVINNENYQNPHITTMKSPKSNRKARI